MPTVAIGNPDFYGNWRATPELKTMSVSYPTMAAYGDQGTAGGAYWFFRPTATGRVSFDALLSHWMDDKLNTKNPRGPSVYLYLYRAEYAPSYDSWNLYNMGASSSFSAAFGQPSRDQGRFVMDVVAGETYVVATRADEGFPYIRTVVRIGDYAEQPDWVQPDDQEYVYGQLNANRLPSAPPGVTYFQSGAWASGVGFEGASAVAHAFAGEYPGNDPNAVACTWKYARRVQTGIPYWSTNNSGSWNGTDPYDPSVPANPTCPVYTFQDVDCSAHYWDWPVGYQYYSQDPSGWLGGGYSNQGWRVFGTSCYFMPQAAVQLAGRTGLGRYATTPPYLPALEGYAYIEWESSVSTLVGLYWSWDEVNGGGGVQTDSPVFVKWYMGRFEEYALAYPGDADWSSGRWGPFGDFWFGDAMGEDAGSWAATQQHLGDTAGGYSNWYPVPENMWALEKIRFTALPDNIFGDGIPNMGQNIYGTGISIYKYRSGQYMAIKALIRPSRYRVVPDPGIENLDWAGTGAIALAFDDGGKVFY